MIATFQGEGLDPERFHLIDAVTRMTIPNPKPVEGCSFVSSPSALGEIYTMFSQLLEHEDFGALILDSISTVLVYEQPQVVLKFLHMLITKASVKGCHGAFICLKEDMSQQLLRELNMLVDVVRDYAKDIQLLPGEHEQTQGSQQQQPLAAAQPAGKEKKQGFMKRLFGKTKPQHDAPPPPPS